MNFVQKILVFGVLALLQAPAQQNPSESALPAAPATVLSLSAQPAEIVPGRLIHAVDAKYPKEARKSKIEGDVELRATIAKDGSVSGLAIVRGDLILAEAAVDAVREWTYEPFTRNGQPVEVQQNLVFKFSTGVKVAELEKQPPPIETHPPVASLSLVGAQKRDSTAEQVFRAGGGVTPPKVIYSPDPAYTKSARMAKYQGTCILSFIVGSDGQPRDIKIVRAIGKGLDAKAVEAVSTWKFEPGTKDGKPVAVVVNVEVQFHLY